MIRVKSMKTKSRAVVSNGSGKFSIEITQIEEPRDDELLIRIHSASLCHTDYDSLFWGKPLIMGHEGAGVVEKTGDSVIGFSSGDKVVLNWATPCNHCFQCIKGNYAICENNSPVVAGSNGYNAGHARLESTQWNGQPVVRSFNLGTFSEYALVRQSACVKIPDKMPFDSASIISCGVLTGYGSVVNVAKPGQGNSVVVIGTGGVGLNVIQGAKLSGASPIIAVDIREERLQMAKKFGATVLLKPEKEDTGLLGIAEKIRTLTNGRGADFAFECTAVPELGAAPLAVIRNGGTAVQVSGIEQSIEINMELFEWNKLYINPLYGKCNPGVDIPRIIRHYQNGELLLDEMISKKYKPEDLNHAFDDMKNGKIAKGVIHFGI